MIIDIQEKLVPVVKYPHRLIDNTEVLILLAQELGIPILVTEQYPKGLGKTVPRINDRINKNMIYEKISFSAYTDEIASNLAGLERKKIIITGMETHVCVYQTVRDLIAMNYQVFVVGDAVGSREKRNYKNALDLMSGMGAVITNTETVFFDLIKVAGTPMFKKMSPLIK